MRAIRMKMVGYADDRRGPLAPPEVVYVVDPDADWVLRLRLSALRMVRLMGDRLVSRRIARRRARV